MRAEVKKEPKQDDFPIPHDLMRKAKLDGVDSLTIYGREGVLLILSDELGTMQSIMVVDMLREMAGDLLADIIINIVHDAVVDGIADNIRDVAHIAGRQSVGHGGHGCGVVGDGHRAVADGGSDVGRRPVDAGPCALIGSHAADHHGEHTVGVGAQSGVRLAVHHIGAGSVAAHIDLHRDVVLVEHQLVLRVAHHRLVGQLFVGGYLRESSRQSHKEQEDKE